MRLSCGQRCHRAQSITQAINSFNLIVLKLCLKHFCTIFFCHLGCELTQIRKISENEISVTNGWSLVIFQICTLLETECWEVNGAFATLQKFFNWCLTGIVGKFQTCILDLKEKNKVENFSSYCQMLTDLPVFEKLCWVPETFEMTFQQFQMFASVTKINLLLTRPVGCSRAVKYSFSASSQLLWPPFHTRPKLGHITLPDWL